MKKYFQPALILISLFLVNLLHAENEPNNSYQQASTFLLNSSDSGTLFYVDAQNNDEIDWWKISLPVDGSLYVETNSTNDLDIDLYIYDIDGTTSIASYDISIGMKESTHHNALKAGTYYIKAVRYRGSGSYTIFNKFVEAPYNNDPEPNDIYEHALLLNLNSETTGHIGYYQAGNYDDLDWYKITIPYDGSLKIRTESDSAEIDLYLYDVDGKTQIASYDISVGLIEETHFNYLMPGTYFVKVVKYSKHGGYKISNTYIQTSIEGIKTNDAENNDSSKTAQSIGVFSSNESKINYGLLGYYSNGYTDNVDWWSVDIQTDGKLIVKTISNETLDIDLYLYDVDGKTQIASYDISTGMNEQTHFNNLAYGKYFIKAIKYSGYGSYKITAEFTKAKLADDKEPNDDFVNASIISSDVIYTGHLGYYSNEITDNNDYYKLTLTSNWDSLYVRADMDSTLDLDLSLYDNLQNQISSSGTGGIKEILSFSKALQGVYFIRVAKYFGYGSYAIKATNHYPGNLLTDIKNEEIKLIPTSFTLYQNYPNPFNPSTKIKYDIPVNTHVTLKVYDILGNEAATLVDEFQNAGSYIINFSTENNSSEVFRGKFSSGVYFYRLEAGSFSQVKKFILLK